MPKEEEGKERLGVRRGSRMHHDHLSRCNRKQVWVSPRPIVSNLPGDQDGVGGVAGVRVGLGEGVSAGGRV